MTEKLDKSVCECNNPFIVNNSALSEQEVEFLKQNCKLVEFSAGDFIFRQNFITTDYHFLQKGLIKIVKRGKQNKTLIINILGDDNFFGVISTAGDSIYQYSAQAVEKSVVCKINKKCVKKVCEQNGKFALQLTQLVSTKGLMLLERLMNFYQKQLPSRVADIFLYFSEDLFKSESFIMPFTRKELSEFVGSTKESFIRTLTEFRNDKIIKMEGKKVEIISLDILKKLSEIG